MKLYYIGRMKPYNWKSICWTKTIWLSLTQMAQLFDIDKSVISRHICDIYKENGGTVAKKCNSSKGGLLYKEY